MFEMLGQMMWLPVTLMTGCMNVMATTLANLQRPMGDRAGCCGGRQVPIEKLFANAPATDFPGDRSGRLNPGDRDDGANKQAKEEGQMSDSRCCDHGDRTVKLVEYTIVTIKPCDERIIHKGEEIYADAMSDEGFAAWVIAKYLQDPKHKPIPDDEKKYLRVNNRVLDEWPRPCDVCDDRQVDVLKEINQAIRDLGQKWGGGPQPAAAPAK